MRTDIGEKTNHLTTLIITALIMYLGIVILRNAWIGDDAYITFRTIDNFINGYGLTWNVAERVQVFTHPLWVILLIPFYFLTGDIYYTSLAISIVLSLLAVWLILRNHCRNLQAGVMTVLLLLLSKSFIDYTTSGLENPLTYLILVVFTVRYFQGEPSSRRLFDLSLIASLGALARLDTILLYLPLLLAELWRLRNRKALLAVVVGMTPLMIWELFSIIYYGFPFPNTYYAKIHTGIPKFEVLAQGLFYFLDTINLDPLTLLVIGMAIVAAAFRLIKSSRFLVIGMILYLFYTVWVGGDFMSGRFFAAPYLLAVILLTKINTERMPNVWWWIMVVSLLIGLTSVSPPILSDSSFGTHGERVIHPNGICDERAFYYQHTGLLGQSRYKEQPNHPWADEGKKLALEGESINVLFSVGYLGFKAGPKVYLIDRNGLTDPLLARIPIAIRRQWRVGHYFRDLPLGYLETVEKGEISFADTLLGGYFRQLRVITQDPVWKWERIKTVVKFNLGLYDKLVDHLWYGRLLRINYSEICTAVLPRTVWNAPGVTVLSPKDCLSVTFDKRIRTDSIEVSVDNNDVYLIEFVNEDGIIDQIKIDPPDAYGLWIGYVEVPENARTLGFDKIIITPLHGDSYYSVGHLLIP